jgi:hypothetical protein
MSMPDAVGIQGTGDETACSISEVRGWLIDALTRVATECGYPAVEVEQIATSPARTSV